MNRSVTVVVALGAAALLWSGASAQQEVRDRPGFGSGSMDVRVINHPPVLAAQNGEWRVTLADTANVRIANVPTVSTAAPAFLRSGTAYRVTWSGGRTETVTVRGLGANGWVQVDSAARERWINLGNAESVEETR